MGTMNHLAPTEGLQVTSLYPGVQLWKPANDLLHAPNVMPQDRTSDEVLLGLPLGECGGVQMANRVIEKLGERPNTIIYGNHAPTHGADSTAAFQHMGAQFGVAPTEVALGMPYVISAHGAAPNVKADASVRGIEVYDVTCPLVSRTHNAILRAGQVAGGRVAYISFGSPNHAERVGAAGVAEQTGIPFTAIGDTEDADELVSAATPDETIVIVGQTTNNSDEAAALAAHLYEQAALRGIAVKREGAHDVCHTVRDRQRSTREIVRTAVGALIVVGSVNSKNTKSLAVVAAEEAAARNLALDIFLTNSWGQLPQLEGRVGVVSGASTRALNVEGVIERLAPRDGVTLVGEDTDKGIIFTPIDRATRRLFESE